MYKSETILKVLKENNHIFSGKVIDMLEENIREEIAKSSGKKISQSKALAKYTLGAFDYGKEVGYVPYKFGNTEYFTYFDGYRYSLYLTTSDYGYKELDNHGKYDVNRIAPLERFIYDDGSFKTGVRAISIDRKEIELAKKCNKIYILKIKIGGSKKIFCFTPSLVLSCMDLVRNNNIYINMESFGTDGIYKGIFYIASDDMHDIACVLPVNPKNKEGVDDFAMVKEIKLEERD